MTVEDANRISVVVCTRNRGSSIVCPVQTILASTHPNFELIIIDQSTNEDTAQAVAPFLNDARVRYLRTATQGLGRARNLGLREASSTVVVFTDDDCQVPPHWMATMQAVFSQHSQVAVAFCNVAAADYDPSDGFIPAYQRRENLLLTSIKQKPKARGIGAGIAVRREAVLGMGGFDEHLGAGGLFPSCEDGDMAVRALLSGWHVYETRDVSVLHFGYRKHSEGRELSRRDWLAIGAAYSKPLKAGRWDFTIVPAYEFFVMALWPPLRDLLRLRRPVGVTRITSFVKGFVQGWRTPIDKKTLLFRIAAVSPK